ncbi:MAG: hypothetical protein NVS4B2_35270 [Chloroflexota bacterium]
MTTPPDDVMAAVRQELASWHATHPNATLADMETAVETQIERLRAALLQEHVGVVRQEEHPACPHCGTTMEPHHRAARTVILRGEDVLHLERPYVICPACRTGLFPPG